MNEAAEGPGRTFCMSEVDIFADLDEAEMQRIADTAPMETYSAGTLFYSPHQPLERLFILKRGRVRIFRVSSDGRALTTAIVEPGTVFGEMVIVGQQMHDSFAEALDDSVVCVMSRSDVQTLLLADARIAARIAAILGTRVASLEQRLSDTVFKSVSERIASTLCLLTAGQPAGRRTQLSLTHEQLAALAGTSRETVTKALGEFADRGLVRLGRGKLVILDHDGLVREKGD